MIESYVVPAVGSAVGDAMRRAIGGLLFDLLVSGELPPKIDGEVQLLR